MKELAAAAMLLLAQTYAGVDMRQNGAAIGRARFLNCTTGMSCWVDGGVGFVTSTGGSGGGGAGTNVVNVTLSFGVGGSDTASTIVTGQTWVTSSSVIVCAPTMLAASGRSEGAEDAIVEQLSVAVSNRSAGVGFTVKGAVPVGKAFGDFVVQCVGI